MFAEGVSCSILYLKSKVQLKLFAAPVKTKIKHFCGVDLIFSLFLQKLECPKTKGQLLIFGATNWDLIGRKEVPKQQGRIV